MTNWKKWKKKIIEWIIYAHYGQKHPFCKHPKVDIKTVYPVTLQSKTGVCKICKKEVIARTVWEVKQ